LPIGPPPKEMFEKKDSRECAAQPKTGFKSLQEKFGTNRSSSTSKRIVEVHDVS
jgi:hypothetical protein